MNHTISFRRPELRHELTKMSVPRDTDAATQIRRLKNLGNKIVDVSPPLERYGPPQNPQIPELDVVGDAKSSLRNGAE